jgi:hypothetical protein
VSTKVGSDGFGAAHVVGFYEQPANDAPVALVYFTRSAIAHTVRSPLDGVGRMIRRVKLEFELDHEEET